MGSDGKLVIEVRGGISARTTVFPQFPGATRPTSPSVGSEAVVPL